MELEELKTIWRQREPEFRRKDASEIESMLKGKSTSIVAKLKRNVWIELSVTVGTTAVLLTYALSLKPGAMKWTSISILVMCLAATIYFVKKLVVLNRFYKVNENLHDTLLNLIANLKGYLKFYKRSYAILYAVYFFLGLLFAALENRPEDYIEFLLRPNVIVYLTLGAALFYFGSTAFANWYIKKLYGDHLAKLQGILYDLEH